ncbi:MAG TPA: hypothetical protein VLV76_26305 [Candidatus Acidoferrum sp.]|nr:hypothetical protein [Candidatus Acidoferrum sp.]
MPVPPDLETRLSAIRASEPAAMALPRTRRAWFLPHWHEIVLVLLLAGAFGFCLTTTLHHDVSWYLVATNRLLDGALLYVDIIEVNPPLAFYLTMPPVAFARLTGIAPAACFIGYVFLLIAVSLFLIRRLLDRQAALSAGYRSVMLLAAATALAVAPIGVFGQREHLMLIFALPYLLLMSARIADQGCDRRFAAVIGLFAAIGFCLKPHFFLVPALPELYLAAQRRSPSAVFRPESWSLLAAAVLYALFVAVAHPQYFDVVLPNALLVYDAYSSSLRAILLQPSLYVLAPVAAVYAVLRSIGIAQRRTDAFAAATIGAFAGYVLQAKGWPYQLLPTTAIACLAAVAMLAETVAEERLTQGTRLLSLAAGGGALILPLFALAAGGTYRNPVAPSLLPAVEKYADGGTIYAFTSYVSVGFPLVNEAHVRWASRFPAQWLLPGALRHLAHPQSLDPDQEARLRQIERYATEAVIEDLARAPPDLVIVDKSRGYYGDLQFDALAYFGRSARFAEFWRPYLKIGDVNLTIGGTRLEFELWCRRNAARHCTG